MDLHLPLHLTLVLHYTFYFLRLVYYDSARQSINGGSVFDSMED